MESESREGSAVPALGAFLRSRSDADSARERGDPRHLPEGIYIYGDSGCTGVSVSDASNARRADIKDVAMSLGWMCISSAVAAGEGPLWPSKLRREVFLHHQVQTPPVYS